jgi:hypothetical protein
LCWPARSRPRGIPGWPPGWGFPLSRCGSGARGSPSPGRPGSRPPAPRAAKGGPGAHGAEREQLARWARREDVAGPGAAGEDRAGLRRRPGEQGRRRGAADHRAQRGAVAGPVHRAAAGRAKRREAPRPAAVHPPGQGRGGRHRHIGGAAPGRDALVAGLDGPAQRPVAVHSRADLAQVRPQAAPHRRLQAAGGPAVRGEGRRRRRPLPQPAGEGGRAVRGREVAGADPGPVPAGDPKLPGMPERRTHDCAATAWPACSPRSTSKTAP